MVDNTVAYSATTATHSVFERDLRRVGWPRTAKQMGRYVGVVAVIAGILTFVLCAAAASRYGDLNALPYQSNTLLTPFSIVLLGIGIAMGFVADGYYVLLPVGGIQREIASGHWDMLRLTNLDHEQIVSAKYVVNHLRARRVMIVEIAIRTAVTVPLCFMVFFAAMAEYRTGYYDTFLTYLTLCLSVLPAAIAYILEPSWRMQTLVAVGVATAVESRRQGTFVALAWAFMARLLQLSILVGIAFVALHILSVSIQILPVVVTLAGFADYALYNSLGTFALKRALQVKPE